MPKVTTQKNHGRKPASAVDRIQAMGFGDDDGIKLLLYGKSGTGKTTLWATFPGPILAIISSSIANPGELRSIDTAANRKKIQTVNLQSVEEIRDLVDHAASGSYRTVVLDHASGMQDLALKEILGLEELPAQRSWGMATREQWGQCSLQTKELLRSILGLTGNVVIVAQERNFNDEGTGSDLLMPTVGAALSPSVVGWLNPACDYIGETFIRQKMRQVKTKVAGKEVVTTQPAKGQVEFCLRTAPDPVFTTKFRKPKGAPMPECIVDPDYQKIMNLIQQGG